MSAIKGSYYPPEIIDTDGNIENEGVYGNNTPFVSDDHMGIINLQGANIDYLKTAVDNLGSNTTALTNLINSNKSTQDAKNTAYDSHLSTLDSKTATNASNITALQTSDNDKFKTATVSNATITLTKGTGETTSLTVNNVANATNATNATYSTHTRDIYYDLGSFAGKTIADLRTAIMNAAIAIGRGNTAYLRFVAKFSDITSGWGTTTTAITDGEWVTVRISSTAITGGNYFHGTIYTYDVPEYTFSVINGVWSALNRNLVQSDYNTLNSAITTTNTNLSSLSSTVTSNKSAQDTKNSSYESRLTAVESKATTYATIEYIDGRVANLKAQVTEGEPYFFLNAEGQISIRYNLDTTEAEG